MPRCVPLAILFGTSIAFAQPKPAARVPMRSVPCLPQDATLHAANGQPVICWDKGCMKLDIDHTAASWSVKPPPAVRPTASAEVKDDQVCLGTTCKKFGKKLTAALAATKREPDRWEPTSLKATADLKTVVFGGFGTTEVWNVAGDSKLKLPTPKLYAKTGEKPGILGVDIAGSLLVVQWSACAGPCTKFSIIDSSGRAKGPEGEGGGEVFQLDAKRFAVVSEYATIAVFDLGTAKPRGIVRLGGSADGNSAVRGDDTTMFSMIAKNDGAQVIRVDVHDDGVLEGQSMFLPGCQP